MIDGLDNNVLKIQASTLLHSWQMQTPVVQALDQVLTELAQYKWAVASPHSVWTVVSNFSQVAPQQHLLFFKVSCVSHNNEVCVCACVLKTHIWFESLSVTGLMQPSASVAPTPSLLPV